MWKATGESELAARDAYDVLSKFAHPRGTGLRWLIHFDVESTFFHFGPYFDLRDLRTTLFFLLLIGQGLLDHVAQLQSRALGKSTRSGSGSGWNSLGELISSSRASRAR